MSVSGGTKVTMVVIRRALHQPFERVERALLEGPETWIPGLQQDGSLIVIEGGRFHRDLGGPVRVAVQRLRRERGHLVFHLSLEPADPRYHPLPRFEGWLSATALPHGQTRVALHLGYVPPGGRLGALVDHIALAGVAADMIGRLAEAIDGAIERRALSLAWEAEAPARGGT